MPGPRISNLAGIAISEISMKSVNLTMAFCYAYTIITKKPNPPKDGDGKPRVLASSEKPWKTSRRTQDRRAADTASTESAQEAL